MRFQSLPKDTKLYTPSGRLAQVKYCEDGKVHVIYIDRGHLRNEEGVFPLDLVFESDIVRRGTACDDASPYYFDK
jgi:hypothetical protein